MTSDVLGPIPRSDVTFLKFYGGHNMDIILLLIDNVTPFFQLYDNFTSGGLNLEFRKIRPDPIL